MTFNSAADDQELLDRLKTGDKQAFRALYDQYYRYLVVTAYNVLGDADTARDLSQDVFVGLWKKREDLNIKSALKPYLRRAVINKTLNHIKGSRIDFSDPQDLPPQLSTTVPADEQMEASQLEEVIHSAISDLPERCRIIFTLCRLEGMSHREIAEKLNISTKTIENQMTRALSMLRKAIEPYIDIALVFLFFLSNWLNNQHPL